MEYIKTHKMTFVAILILIVLVVILIQLKNFFAPSENGAAYGDRLADIKTVEIKKSLKEEIGKKLKSDGKVKSATARTQGRILRTVIHVNDNVSVDDAKSLASIVKDALSDKQKKYYDIEVLIKKDKDEKFPIIGYKQHTKDGFSWTKNR